jgi:hypothetical protein
MMGVETPIPLVMINAAAPKGAPRRIDDQTQKQKSARIFIAPPCLGEALRRGSITNNFIFYIIIARDCKKK